MNKEEVKKALEYCINAKGMNDCSNCKFSLHPTYRDMIIKEALQLINEQEEEIEMLEQDIDGCGETIERLEKAVRDKNEQEAEIEMLQKTLADILVCVKDTNGGIDVEKLQKQAVREFAEKLKEKLEDCYIPYCFETPIDEFAYNAKEVEKIIAELLKEYEK